MKKGISLFLAICMILMSCLNVSVVFAASVQNTIKVGEGTVVIGTERYTGQATASFESGKKVYFVVLPPSGKMAEKITYNGAEIADEVDYFTPVDGGVFEVSYTEFSGTETVYYDFSLDDALTMGKTVGVTVKKVVTPSNIKNNKAVESVLKANEYLLVPDSKPDNGTIQVNGDGTVTGLKKGMQQLRVYSKKEDGSRGTELARMLVIVSGKVEAHHDYNKNDTSVVTESLSGEAAGNTVLADYQYTVKPAHGKSGTSLYYRNVDKPDSMKGNMDMIKKTDGITQFSSKEKRITEFWIYCDGYADSSTSLFFINGPGLRFWFQTVYDTKDQKTFLHIVPKNGSFAPGNTSASGYNQRVPMKRGWNQIVLDSRGEQLIAYCNSFDFSAYLPKDSTDTRITGLYYDRFIYPDKQVNNYMFLDDYKIYSMESEPVPNTLYVGEGGKVTINQVDYTGSGNALSVEEGSTLKFKITPNEGMKVKSISYNGTSLAVGTTSVTVVKDAVLSVEFEEGTDDFVLADGNYWSLATAGDVKIGEKTKVMVLTETVANGKATITETNGVSFVSSDKTIADIVDGCYILGKKPGVVKITATRFNPNWLGQERTMLVVVGNGAEEGKTKDFDSEALGTYTEKIGNYTNLPYSYVEYPVHGIGGKSLYLPPLKVSKYTDYGFSETGTFYADKSDAIAPVTIEPGKITEFWLRHGDNVEAIDRYIEIAMPDGARIKFVHKAWGSVWSYSHYRGGNGTCTYLKPDGWGVGTVEAFASGTWAQVVIDGSQVDPETGKGTYTAYVNGLPIYHYEAKEKNMSGFVWFHRVMQLSSGAGNNTTSYYVDNAKMYTLPEEPKPIPNTVEAGKGTVVMGKDRYTGKQEFARLEGEKVHFTVLPPTGMITKKIMYNGVVIPDNVDYFTVVKDATLEVTYGNYSGTETVYHDISLDSTLRVGKTVGVTVKKVITPSDIRNNKATEVLVNPNEYELVSDAIPESDVIQVNENCTVTGLKKGMQQLKVFAKNKDGSRGAELARMLVVVVGTVEASNHYNTDDTSVITESLKGESAGNTAFADYQYTVKPAHGKDGTSLYYRNVDKPESMTGTMDMIKKPDGIGGFFPNKKTITEFWIYCDGYTDSNTSLFFVNGPELRFWLQMTYGGGNYYLQISPKAGTFAENNTSISGYNQRVPMKRGWNQVIMDGRGDHLIVYCNSLDFSAFIPKDGKNTGINAMYYDRFIYPDNQVNNYMFLDDYKVYSMDDPTPVSNTIEAGDGTVTINKKDYTGTKTVAEFIEGEEMYLTVTPPQDKLVDSIFYNGQELGDKVDFITVVKDATLKITYRDDPAVIAPSIVIYDKKPLNTEPTKENPYSTHIVYAQLTGWKLISDYGMKVTSKAGNSVELPGLFTAQALHNLSKCEGKFAVKMYGDGIDGVTCTVTPYLVYHEETIYGESSEEFTGKVSE